MPSRKFNEAFERLAAAENAFLQSEFLAPVLRGDQACVRVAGVVYKMKVEPADFEGWGVFQPKSVDTAELVRPAGLAERQRYLKLFPMVRLITCLREEGHWLAASAHQGDTRFNVEGLAPVRLTEEVDQFDTIQTRFDGQSFWFDSVDMRADPAAATYLRDALSRLTKPNDLSRPGLSAEQRAAYAVGLLTKEAFRKQQEAERTERRIRDALDHAGAELLGFLERRDSYRVTYRIGRQRHVTAVNKRDLTVQVAGICLAGRDRDFDLSSLVGVIREGEREGDIYRIGPDGMNEEEYWRVHPPET